MAACSFIDYRLQAHGVAVLTLDNPPLNLTTLATLISSIRPAATLQATRKCAPS